MRAVRAKRRRESGAIAVLMAFTMTIIMGFAAFGFDLSYVRLARTEMMNATDAATHAAAIALSSTGDAGKAQENAISVAASNTVLGNSVLLTNADIGFGSYDFTTKTYVAGANPATAVQITGAKISGGNGYIQATFGRIFGIADMNVSRTAMAAFANRYFQVQLQVSDDWICDIDNAAAGAVAFLDFLVGPGGSQTDWIGLDTFTGMTRTLTPQMNVRQRAALDIRPVWLPDATTLGVVQGSWSGSSPPPPPQTRGIAVCSKGNAPAHTFPGPPVLPANPGGYRQCPPIASAGLLPTAQQYAFPNHDGWTNPVLRCSDGGPAGLFAGTDLGAAIHDAAVKLKAVAQTYEPKVIILIANGVPMACTGIGGGSLCGHTYGGDGVPPPAGKVSSDYWDPCCANGLTCGANVTHKGYTFGGGDWGDGSPSNSPNGGTACTAAHTLVEKAMDEADLAAADGIDIFVIGFFRDPNPAGLSQSFLLNLSRGEGVGKGVLTNDSTQIGALMKKIPQHIPVAIVR